MRIVDANVILRYLLDDHPLLSAKAAKQIESNQVFIPSEVVCEVVYVLEKVYSVERIEIMDKLTSLMESPHVSVFNIEIILQGLKLYSSRKLDFVDALLCAYHKVNGDEIITFDEQILKILRQS
ncbi:MAG TPA: pilus assembly protein [Lentisphaeria bacterium]|nr:MAG: pilus assembly protein [Lentisphaerae bacterium GWF2_49_21]HBC86153.1 pilus assembly protein [Lentisphaeria bacterium]